MEEHKHCIKCGKVIVKNKYSHLLNSHEQKAYNVSVCVNCLVDEGCLRIQESEPKKGKINERSRRKNN